MSKNIIYFSIKMDIISDKKECEIIIRAYDYC